MTLLERVTTDLYRVRRTLLTMPYLADAMQFIAAAVAALVVLMILGAAVPRFGWLAWLAGGATALAVAGSLLRRSWRRRLQHGCEIGTMPSLAEQDLRHRELASIRLYNRDLTGASLDGANLTHATLTGATLDRASLPGANLSYASLNVSHGSEAVFTGARLFGTRFDRGWARDADFDGADLRHASFVETDLRGASFDGADVRGTDFSDARLDRAALETALTSSATILPDGERGEGIVQPFAVRWETMVQRAVWLGAKRALFQVSLGTTAVLVIAGATAVVGAVTHDPSTAAAARAAASADETAAAVVDIDVTPITLRPLPSVVTDETSPDVIGRDRTDRDPTTPDADTETQGADIGTGEVSGGGASADDREIRGEIDELSPVEAEEPVGGDGGRRPPPGGQEEIEPDEPDADDPATSLEEAPGTGAEPGQLPDPGQGGAASAGPTAGVRIVLTSTSGSARATVRSALGDGAFGITRDQPFDLEVPAIGVLRITVAPDEEAGSASCSVLVDGIERLGRQGRAGEAVTCELDLDRIQDVDRGAG